MGAASFGSILLYTLTNNLSSALIVFCIAFVIVAMLGKILGCGLFSKICRFNISDSLKIGIGMMTRGEVALIVAQKCMSVGMITAEYFTAVILLIICTSVLTPILLKLLFRGDEKRAAKKEEVKA